MQLAGLIILTTACPVECSHCAYSCKATKEPEKWMSEETIRMVAKEFSKNNINYVLISGGEPFYNLEKLEKCIDILLKYFKPTIAITTSGFWANNKNYIKRVLTSLKEKINSLEISIDRFHIERVPLINIKMLLNECTKLKISSGLRLILDKNSKFLIKTLDSIIKKYNPYLIPAITNKIGRAELFDNSSIGNNLLLNNFLSKIKTKKI